jgi:hypothetical protein
MDDFFYLVERFDVSGEEESLIERVELVREGSTLVFRNGAAEVRLLNSDDVTAAIAAEPALHEIRANQVTRIRADGSAYDELPFLLRIVGDPNDFDECLWSEAMLEEHLSDTGEECLLDTSAPSVRVAYVNGERWSPYRTDDGPRMLSEETTPLKVWGELYCEERSIIGLVTPLVVAALYIPDTFGADDSAGNSVALWRRPGDRAGEASILANWLLDWVPRQCGIDDEAHRQMLAQLFVERAVRGVGAEDFPLTYLAAGHREQPEEVADAVWNLHVRILPGETLDLTASLIAGRNPEMAAIVSAARNPNSPEGMARRAAVQELGDWDSEFEPDSQDNIEVGLAEEQQSYDDDPDAPWNRDPVEDLPELIQPGTIKVTFWKGDFDGPPVAYDFIFTWGGGREADWYYDISPENSGLSVMSSAPISGTAKWTEGNDVQVEYSSTEFDLNDETTLEGSAPDDGELRNPHTWVELGRIIAGLADDLVS